MFGCCVLSPDSGPHETWYPTTFSWENLAILSYGVNNGAPLRSPIVTIHESGTSFSPFGDPLKQSGKPLSTYQSGTSTMGGFIYQVYIIILWEWYGSGIGKILVGVVWGM